MEGPKMEIERKFLVRLSPEMELRVRSEGVRIIQCYLPSGVPGTERRVRGIFEADGTESWFLTVKRGRGMVREEDERRIGRQEAKDLVNAADAASGESVHALGKQRLRLGGWEIDLLEGEDLAFAEYEMESVDSLHPPFPDGVTMEREVTGEIGYSSRELAKKGGVSLLHSLSDGPAERPPFPFYR